MTRSWWIGLFLFLLPVAPAMAQQPVLYFKRMNKASGLSHNKVNCILQDRRGFTWIGTDDGLNRYDGQNYMIFKNTPGDPSTISGNTITDLHEDKEGILWIATADGGISRYDYRLPPEKKFLQYKHQPSDSSSIPVNIINSLEEDSKGNLWLATGGAAVIGFDKKKGKFLRPEKLGNGTIYDMTFDREGMIWAGREGGSILKVDPQTLEWKADERYANLYASLPHVVVTKLFRDSRHNIWFGSWDKAIYRHNALTGEEETFVNTPGDPFSFGVDEAIAFNEDRNGMIWIGGRYFGLYLFDQRLNRFYNYRHDPGKEGTLSDNRVNCIFIDRSGLVWLGTNNGLSIYNSSQQQFVQQFLPGRTEKGLTIYDFFRQADGPLWIGTNQGIYIQEKNGAIIQKKLAYKGAALSVTKFFRDDSGNFFVGTDYTLFRLDPQNWSISALENTEKDEVMVKLIESRIVSIEMDELDGHPVLWTTPYGHFLSYYDLAEKKWYSRKDSVRNLLTRFGITDNLIRKVIRTSDGNIWLANAKQGITLLNRNGTGSKSFINNPAKPGTISNNNVFDLREDDKGNLWISTYGGGLNYFDTKKLEFEHYSSVNNLLEGISIDNSGNVWAITNGGLQKFHTRSKAFSYYELPDVEKTGGVKGYIYKDYAGRMYIAGNGYYIAFEPEKIGLQRSQPEVFLTDLSIFNKSFSHLLFNRQVTLKHNQNFFTIHFAAPFYTTSSPVQYSYMLEGVDQDWVLASPSFPQAQYTNLDGGEYVFRVRATATPGTWSEKVTTIQIRIIPPYWKRGWFYLALAIVIGAIAYAAYRYRINELLKRQAIRNKIAQDLHDNMGSTLSSISVYSQVAKIYNEKTRHQDLQQTLEKISNISGEMISEMNDIVWAINPRNDNMNTILQRMESFAKPLLASQDMQFHFTYEQSIKQLNLDMTRRKNFYLIFKEAVHNTLKYSGAKNLWVHISEKGQQLFLTLKDDGKGFDLSTIDTTTSASMGGNGLKNMRMRAEEIGGKLTMESHPGQGVIVNLQFPIP